MASRNVVLAAALLLIPGCGPSPEELAEMAALEAVAIEQKLEERRLGVHCLSEDGVYVPAVDALKEVLAEPDSFVHLNTIIEPVNMDGLHSLTIHYQAGQGDTYDTQGMIGGRVKQHDCSIRDATVFPPQKSVKCAQFRQEVLPMDKGIFQLYCS